MRKKQIAIIIIILALVAIISGVLVVSSNRGKVPRNIPGKTTEEAKIKNGQKPLNVTGNFEEVIPHLNTSQKLVDYLNENFKIEERKENTIYPLEKVFEEKKGGRQDLARLSAYILYENKFIPFVVRYHYILRNGREEDNYVVEFRDTDLPKYIYFDKNGAHLLHHGWSFEALCQKEEERLGAKITKYGTISPLALNLNPKEWVERK